MVILIGHGYVGKYIAKELINSDINFRWIDHTHVKEIGLPTEASFIINAAGYVGNPTVDVCEYNKQETINGNVIFPLSLEKFGLPVLHITSGCVYNGYIDGGWREDHEPNFNFDNGSFYSGSKALFQMLMEPYLHKSYLFRIRMPFSSDNNPKNLLVKLRTYPKLVNTYNSLSNIEEVAKAVVYFYVNRPPYGIYNAVNEYGVFTRDIIEMLRINKTWISNSEFEYIVKTPRSNCVLNNDKMQSVFKFDSVFDAINRCNSNLQNTVD